MTSSEFNYLKGLCRGHKLDYSTKALAFILKSHGGQTREDGSPYYAHPVKVASHLAALNIFKDEPDRRDTLLTTALLHDILEDTGITAAEIEKEFSGEIANAVTLLTKIDGVSNEVYYDRVRTDLIASLVKISDRCHNVSTMAGVFNKSRLERYVDETNTLVKPLIRHIRDNYPGISDSVVTMSYHIKSVINAIEVMLPLMSE